MNKTTILIVAALLIIAGAFYYSGKQTMKDLYPEKDIALKTFSTYEEFNDFLESSQELGYGMYDLAGGRGVMMVAESADGAQKAAPAASEYSTTNIQVEGVDEADIVKNDGKYIYTISGNKVVIVDAYPVENAKILSEIKSDDTLLNLFINNDKLVVLGQRQAKAQKQVISEKQAKGGAIAGEMPFYPYYEQETFIDTYDVTDKENPKLVDDVALRGYYFGSRMVGDYVYLVVNEDIYFRENMPAPLPAIVRNGVEKEMPVTEILCPPYPDTSYRYTNILAINTQDKNEDLAHKVVLTGNSQSVYMSLNNLYLTGIKTRSWIDYRKTLLEKTVLPLVSKENIDRINSILSSGLEEYKKWSEIDSVVEKYRENLPSEKVSEFNEEVQEKVIEVQREWAKESEKTVIHRISVDKGNIEYKADGEVPGRVLNQFSMDEYKDHFRIATTAGYASTKEGEETSSNNVYVLNMGLDVVGKVEDLALGEKIYSARFIGDRCYLVTFRNIDPLFVIDLADPINPKVLGKLKIPGYSDYLHPYDETHLIGLGKWTVDAKEGDFAWYQGLKISLFDVSDVSKPKEVAKYELGDRGTDSYALHDHKAFLFDRDKKLLVIPVLLAEIDKEKYPQGLEPMQYGDYTFQGAYVFNIDLDSGIELKGRITHVEDEQTFLKSGYYYYNDAYSVKRSLYMDNTLYTLSNKIIKMNKLDTLDEVNKIELPYEDSYYGPYYAKAVGLEV